MMTVAIVAVCGIPVWIALALWALSLRRNERCYRVYYPDGTHTRLQTYQEAEGLQGCFGGTIKREQSP